MASQIMEDGKTSIYLYIDEAGNFDFSPKGSKYLILTCAVMGRPFKHIADLAEIKYDCLEGGFSDKSGKNCHEFHAAQDWQALRDKVFEVIARIAGLSIYSVIIRKNRTNPSIRNPEDIYSKAFNWLIEDVKRGEGIDGSNHVVVITDAINFKGKNDVLKATLMHYVNKEFDAHGISSVLYQHQSCSDFNLQVVDYCSWAVQRRWEKGDGRSFEIVSGMVRKEADIFRNGDVEYYQFGKKK